MKALLTLLFASLATSSYAQQAVVNPQVPSVATHADSTEVIRRAFRSGRRFGRFGTFAEGLGAGTQVATLASGQLNDAPGKQIISIVSVVGYSGFFAVFLTKWIRFSKSREEEAIRRFDLHQPQPLYVRRQLVAYELRKGKR